ncbi:histidine kinase [Anaerobacillus alkaliphilus]|uniref:histidine kinase n=1 Tax=Anaerobacillus alkaliphilus TaxID=1548597 RepID=A0A4Q0VVX0_9BACI|nr:PAS domain-containing sensor histidine kinase [Anaerobacillus alkaliphilus]RXJ02763.1 histidine kinase [Anaerobacillus alkaliphilus]
MFKTLRSKLLGFFLLITFIPLLFLGYISYQSQKQELTKFIEQSLLTYSNEIALDIELLLLERLSDLKYLANNPVLAEPSSSKEEIEEQFKVFLDIYNIYSDVIFVNPEGIAEISVNEKVIGHDISDRKWFKASMEGEIYLSDIYYSPILEEPVLIMSAPVWDTNGNIVGVISPLFDLNYLWRTFNKFSELEQMVGLNGYAFLLNKSGVIIAHPYQEKILNENHLEINNLTAEVVFEKSNDQKIFHNEETDLVLFYVQIKSMEGLAEDWFVGMSVSRKAVFSPLHELLLNYLIVIGLVLFLTTIAVFKLSRFIVDPVEKLVEATSDFAIGKPLPSLVNNSYEEIDLLNQTFMKMTNELAERERVHKKSTLIIETTDNGVFSINKRNQIITTFNRTCERWFELPKSKVINRPITDVAAESVTFQEFIASSQLLNYINEDKRYEVQCENRHYFISLSSLPSLEVLEEEELLIIMNDLTEKKQMEQELFRSEKLKVAGEMAAGLAHEIRNPLTIIRGFIQLYSKEDVTKKRDYELVINEIDRVNHYISDLLNVASPKIKGSNSDTEVVSLLEDILTLQNSQFGQKEITLVKELDRLPTIFADSNKLKQVLINIIQNAVESMQDGGTLTVATKRLLNEGKMSIRIEDTGTGMDEQTIEKLGTPFFTKKTTGTGLGLATSFRIIEEMNGKIEVRSELGKGSTFLIVLPI